MGVLIIKNVHNEGPGTIGDFLRKEGVAVSTVELYRGEAIPPLDQFSHLIIMGGPMAVYEMNSHPFLRQEAAIIEHAIKSGMHILGICLGAQMIAHVLGAKVYPGPQKEIGWYEVGLTDDGMKDPHISGLVVDGQKQSLVFQWHGDTFDLPHNAVRLAYSDLYPNQAFRYSDRVYALQFHIEVTPSIVADWFAKEAGSGLTQLIAQTEQVFPAYHERAHNFYRTFFLQKGSGLEI